MRRLLSIHEGTFAGVRLLSRAEGGRTRTQKARSHTLLVCVPRVTPCCLPLTPPVYRIFDILPTVRGRRCWALRLESCLLHRQAAKTYKLQSWRASHDGGNYVSCPECPRLRCHRPPFLFPLSRTHSAHADTYTRPRSPVLIDRSISLTRLRSPTPFSSGPSLLRVLPGTADSAICNLWGRVSWLVSTS